MPLLGAFLWYINLMFKTVQQIELCAEPPDVERCFDILSQTDPEAPFALFGGAARDADYAAHYNEDRPVNDYDLRVWLPEEDHDERIRQFTSRMGIVARTEIREVPSAGTGRIRYCLNVNGAEMDVSIRPMPRISLAIASVAIERASDSDIGLSSIAMASDRTAWATPEYLEDCNNRTLTVYPRANAERRLREYTERMQQKFPNHIVQSWQS